MYRIFVYDCPPLTKKTNWPISGDHMDFSTTTVAEFRLNFHQELVSLRKIASRLGRLQESRAWKIKPRDLKMLLKGQQRFESLTDDDFIYDVRQKGMDMKIGLDIASVAYKKQVDQIVLVSGDSDFAPAVKLARRKGIDFILDLMW